MHIEKNTKKSLENSRPISGEQKTLIFRIQEWVLNHRLNSREKLLENPINLTTVLAFFPFAVGLFQFLSYTSRSSQNFKKTEYFFEKNLPVFTQFKPKLNFETFEYISKSNRRALLESTHTNLIFGQVNFGITLKKPSFVSNQKFTGLACDFYLLTSNLQTKPSSMMTLSRNLDELPAYVQGLKKVQEETQNEINKKETISQDLFFSNLKTGLEPFPESQPLQILSTNQKPKLDFSWNSKSLSTSKLSLISVFKNTFKKSFSSELFSQSNQFYKDRFDFYNETKQFNTELHTLFTEKNISSFSNNLVNEFSEQNSIQDEGSVLSLFLNRNSQIHDEFLIETILHELEKTKISEDFPNFRFMSGYTYPDMTSEEIYWFYSGNPWARKNLRGFLFETSSLPASSREYRFSIKKFPEITIETNQVSLRNPESNQNFYTGPALILDSQRALDWKTTSKQNFRSWFHTYLSPLNPLIQTSKNFFGVYDSPTVLQDNKIPEFSDFAKTSLFSVKSVTSGPFPGFFDALEKPFAQLSPSTLSFQFPYTTEDGKTDLIRILDVNLSKNKETDKFVTVPILELQHPFISLKDSKSQELQNYSSYFTFTGKGNPDYFFSTDSFTTQNFGTNSASGSYTKRSSVYSKLKQSAHVNVDNWEPLTSRSWLVITQLSFAFFIFHVLKSLADNYGRELLGYLLDLVASLGFLDDAIKQEIEILLGEREKGFRVVLESKKTFKDVVGIQKLLPELYEIIWFLRNSARDFSLSKTLPRGILLTGPPGTGKTLLVQALAGEAKVPVVVLSGSSLIEPGESGAIKLEKVFQEARNIAPCIVFIDEIDTLAQKRIGVVQNPMGADEIVESLTSFEKPSFESPLDKLQLAREKQEAEKDSDTIIQNNSQQQQLSLLTQCLIELDGMRGRDGVIVIGATNRPEVLDPALLRPGRLEKTLQVGLPGPQKRIEILQFYGQALGYQTSIPWDYLGDRTVGFTAADLATLMNESAIKSILNETEIKHTVETIEHGIDRLTTSENEKHLIFKKQSSSSVSKISSLTIGSKMAILRLAYSQAGKIVVSSLLETHPKSVFASLWPRRPTIRSAQIATNLQNSLFEFAKLCELNDRLVGCYAGKAAEILFVQQFSSSKYAQLSTLGLEDLLFAQKLVYCILDKWAFYSKNSHIQKTIQLPLNMNIREFREMEEKLDLYTGIVKKIETPPIREALEIETSSLESKKKIKVVKLNDQTFYTVPWWQQEVSGALEFVEKNFTNWSRFYLYNPEQNERNPEWFPPDEFYHSSSGLKNVKKAFSNVKKLKELSEPYSNNKFDTAPINEKLSDTKTETEKLDNTETKVAAVKERFLPDKAEFSWNEVALLTRDYPGHSLILQSFNKALMLLNKNRELLDRLVIELVYCEILRQPEIEKILEEFDLISPISQDKVSFNSGSNFSEFGKQKKQHLKIIEASWGSQSRKPKPRWIDFAKFSEETT